MLIASSSTQESDAMINTLASLFNLTDNGTPTFHLGCSITCNRGMHMIKIDQQTYTQSILQEFGYENCNPIHTPMDLGKHLLPQTTPLTSNKQNLVDKFPYCAVVGKSMYLSVFSHPNISYMVGYRPSHIAAVKHLLRILEGNTNIQHHSRVNRHHLSNDMSTHRLRLGNGSWLKINIGFHNHNG